MIPPNLFAHPSMAIFKAPSMTLAPKRTRNATKRNTRTKASIGNHRCEILVLAPIYSATTSDSFNAAASPTTKASKENIATTKPLRKPFMTDSSSKPIAMKSMNILLGQ